MSSNKPVKTVSVKCACGAMFTREVKRGRPQVWCPSCVEVPFYERTAEVAASVVETVEEAPARIVNENDRLDDIRPQIEARMVVLNAEAKAATSAVIAKFGVYSDEHLAQSAANYKAILDMYAELAPKFYSPGREFTDV